MKLFRRVAATLAATVLSLGIVSLSAPANASDTSWDVVSPSQVDDTSWD